MTLLCDLDAIVADLLDEWLFRINIDHGTAYTKDDIKGFDIHKYVHIGEKVYDYIRKEGIFPAIKPIPGAIPALMELDDKHDVYIVSTPSSASVTAMEKLDWCSHYLPFLNRKQIILCGAKELIRGDVLIDDSPDNLAAWKKANPRGHTITISYPFNEKVAVSFRAQDYRNTTHAWAEILAYLEG